MDGPPHLSQKKEDVYKLYAFNIKRMNQDSIKARAATKTYPRYLNNYLFKSNRLPQVSKFLFISPAFFGALCESSTERGPGLRRHSLGSEKHFEVFLSWLLKSTSILSQVSPPQLCWELALRIRKPIHVRKPIQWPFYLTFSWTFRVYFSKPMQDMCSL